MAVLGDPEMNITIMIRIDGRMAFHDIDAAAATLKDRRWVMTRWVMIW